MGAGSYIHHVLMLFYQSDVCFIRAEDTLPKVGLNARYILCSIFCILCILPSTLFSFSFLPFKVFHGAALASLPLTFDAVVQEERKLY